MMTDVATPPAESTPNSTAKRAAPRSEVTESDSVFAGLLAAAQGGFGRWTSALATQLHHESNPAATQTADAHEERVRQMQADAEASREGDRSGRLQGGRAGNAEGLSARGQRLALQEQDLARQPSQSGSDNAAPQRATSSGGSTNLPAPGTASSASSVQPEQGSQLEQTAAAKPAAVESPAPTESGRTDQANGTAKTATVGQLAGTSDTAAPPPASAQVAPVPERVDTPKHLSPAASVAKQVGQVLAARGGTESARAVSGTEQTSAARGTAAPSNSGSATKSGGKAAASQQAPNQAGSSKSADSGQKTNFDNLVRSIRMAASGRQSTARMRLDPPQLGWIRIETRVEGDRVQLSVRTETTAAGELLRSRVGELQAALELHGLKVERFEIVSASPQEQQNPTGGQVDQQGDQGQSAQQQPTGPDAERGSAGGQDLPSQTGSERPAAIENEQHSEDFPGAVVDSRLDIRA